MSGEFELAMVGARTEEMDGETLHHRPIERTRAFGQHRKPFSDRAKWRFFETTGADGKVLPKNA